MLIRKKQIKKIVPSALLIIYHYCLATLASWYYRLPAKKLIMIGVTGTKGKTSTASFIWSCLNAGGCKTGLISSATIADGNQAKINTYHMTMPGRFVIQRLLRTMLNNGCSYAVVEVTSEGIKQWRHKNLFIDAAVFTNLTPEHLPSHHHSFDEYRRAKGKLFAALMGQGRKNLKGVKIPKIIVVNNDSEHKNYFLQFAADKKITYGLKEGTDLTAQSIKETTQSVNFIAANEPYRLNVIGKFNVYNALPAIIIAQQFNIKPEAVRRGLEQVQLIPGRMEKISAGQDFTVLVDYAHEKESINAVLDTACGLKNADTKIIILLGAEGGGRDPGKRAPMGEAAGQKADLVIVSNVDPYDDPPLQIIEDIARAAEKAGKTRGQNLFLIADRRAGIAQALRLAQRGDIVLITGKGAEQSINIAGKIYPWDDRQVVREELEKISVARR